MRSLHIQLPLDRTEYGTLTVVQDDALVEFGPIPALGKADSDAATAHHNPSRDPAVAFGDTPYGAFSGMVRFEPDSGMAARRSYGQPNDLGRIPVIGLRPIQGDGTSQAWQRQVSEGMGTDMGLLIHAGDLNGYGGLRPTHGCVRVKQEDLTTLLTYLTGLSSFLVLISAPEEATTTATATETTNA